MKRTLLAILIAVALAGSARPAEAKIFEVWGSGLAGYGWGNGNGAKDFFQWVRGGAAGFEVGAKILFIGAYFDYLRYFGGDVGANLMTFNLGGDWDIKLVGGLSLVLRAAAGYMQGTLPENATLCDANGVCVTQANTRGIGVHGGPGLRYTFLKVLSVGCTPEFGWHYFFGGGQTAINDTDENSSGFDFNVLAYLRVGFGF